MRLLVKLKGGGMDSWIKIICIITISGCSLINTEFLKKSQPLKITDEIKHAQHSIQLIEIDNELEEIFSLSDSSNGNQTWFKGRDLFIITKHGKIIKTIGLDNDFEIISYSGFKSLKDSQSIISFSNPKSGYMDIFFSYFLEFFGGEEWIKMTSLRNITKVCGT